jgi:cupin 2 domain-containing protein
VNGNRKSFDLAAMKVQNLFTNLPPDQTEESVEVLAESRLVRVERIVSYGQASPAGFWYDQEQSEWVVVLQGRAGLQFAGDEQPLSLKPGDHVNIPAHTRHRVAWTAPDEATVWLAVFYE